MVNPKSGQIRANPEVLSKGSHDTLDALPLPHDAISRATMTLEILQTNLFFPDADYECAHQYLHQVFALE